MTDKIFNTRSLQIASFLFTQEDVRLIGFDEVDPKNIYFQFEPYEKCQELENAYLFGTIKVEPKKLMDALGTLKEKVFQIQRSQCR